MSMREKLIGTWVLEPYTQYPVDGSAPVHPLGQHPEGFISYTADGYMSAQPSAPIGHRFPQVTGLGALMRNTALKACRTSPTVAPSMWMRTRVSSPTPSQSRCSRIG
ncbi:hypothetical protein D3C76_89000 [compost metagenome]